MVSPADSRRPRWQRELLWYLLLAVGVEVLTCLLRFGLGLHASSEARFVGGLTFGLRIHHGYAGAAMMVLGWLTGAMLKHDLRPRLRTWLLRIGAALLLSDLVHHFLVLWPLTGSPEFDLIYPS